MAINLFLYSILNSFSCQLFKSFVCMKLLYQNFLEDNIGSLTFLSSYICYFLFTHALIE